MYRDRCRNRCRNRRRDRGRNRSSHGREANRAWDERISHEGERSQSVRMSGKVTIRDIARLAGVSRTTVSRVLNEKPDVDPLTRERIERIVDEQRFVPSVAGAGLAGGRTGLIGLLVPSLTWAIMSPVLSGVTEVVEHTPYELVLYSLGRKH